MLDPIAVGTTTGIFAVVGTLFGFIKYLDSVYARKEFVKTELRSVSERISQVEKVSENIQHKLENLAATVAQVREGIARIEGALGTKPPSSRR